MQKLLLDALASHIVAWHNRHPLARRIGVQHVQSLGYVVLPFVAATPSTSTDPAAVDLQPAGLAESATTPAAEGSTLRERAMARAQQAPSEAAAEVQSPSEANSPRPAAPPTQLLAAFSEDFIHPLRPAKVAAFALQHGALEANPGKDNPVRMVKIDPGLGVSPLQRRWLLTAQIDVGGQRSRVLAGVGRAPALLGKRLWSLPRTGLVVGLPLLTVAVLAMGIKGLLEPGARQDATPAVAVAVAPVQAATESAVKGNAAGSAVAADATAVQPAASASASTAQALLAAPERPIDVDASWGRVNLPSVGPAADERRRALLAARQTAAASAAASPAEPAKVASGAALASAPASPRPTQAPVTSPAPAIHTGPAFALSSRLIRTQAESEQIAEAMRGLLANSVPALQVEALRSGDDWRVVCWPFPTRAQADKALALLASRGMKLQVVDF